MDGNVNADLLPFIDGRGERLQLLRIGHQGVDVDLSGEVNVCRCQLANRVAGRLRRRVLAEWQRPRRDDAGSLDLSAVDRLLERYNGLGSAAGRHQRGIASFQEFLHAGRRVVLEPRVPEECR